MDTCPIDGYVANLAGSGAIGFEAMVLGALVCYFTLIDHDYRRFSSYVFKLGVLYVRSSFF